MKTERFEIRNRHGLKLIIAVDRVENQKGLAVIAHGHGSNMNFPLIRDISIPFLSKFFTVVRFDTTNTDNQSEGKYENGTPTTYYQDLEDVMEWVKDQDFYEKPILAGQSIGGMSVADYAIKNQTKVKSIILVSPSVSGELSMANKPIDLLLKWKKDGFYTRPSTAFEGLTRKYPWSYAEDVMKKSILKYAENFVIPVLTIAGEKDTATPPQHQTLFYWKLKCPKEFHIISDADHDFNGDEVREKLQYLISQWVDKI
ncbi:hypothetical protein BVX95_00335 [archaeon D22]|nr:hypothetical protein BVX95_00335 [archaeon D22]